MIFRLFKYSIKNILRNKFLSVSSILVLTLLIFFINTLRVLDGVSNEIIDFFNGKMTISLYLKDDYSEKSIEISELKEGIKKLSKDIIFEYKNKDLIAKEQKQKKPETSGLLEKYNPYPNTIFIGNIKISEYEKLDTIIKTYRFILSENKEDKNFFANYANQYKNIIKNTSSFSLLKMGLRVIIFIFFIAIIVISYSVISNFIYYYRDEIYITKLVGGSNIFIYGPFVLQGILYSILSFFLSLVFSIILSKYLSFAYEYYFDILDIIMLLEFFIFIFIGAFSGYLSSRKFLKKSF